MLHRHPIRNPLMDLDSSLHNQRLYNCCSSFPVPSEPAKEAPADSKPLADAPEAPKEPVLAEETKEEAPQEEEEQVMDIVANEMFLMCFDSDISLIISIFINFDSILSSCGELIPVL